MIASIYIPHYPAWALAYMGRARGAFAVVDAEQVVAVSSSLAKEGIAAGDPINRFRIRFPEIELVPHDPAVEAAAWERLLEELYRYTPAIFFAGRRCSCEHTDVAVLDHLARSLGVQMGAGPDHVVAEYAAVTGFPGDVHLIDECGRDRWIEELRTEILRFFDFSEEMIARLDMLGLRTFRHLHRLSKRHLVLQFGVEGKRLWDFLRREPRRRLPYFTPPPRLSRRHVFESEVLEPHEWREISERMVGHLSLKLDGRRACMIGLRLSGGSLEAPYERVRMLTRPTSDPGIIARTISQLIVERHPVPFDTLEIALSGIQVQSWTQVSLFDRTPALREALKNVVRRFPDSMKRIDRVDPDAVLHEDRIHLAPITIDDLLAGER